MKKESENIKNIFEVLMRFFEREKIDYGLIGAFALYAYGYVRTTRDIDFIVRLESQDRIICYLESLGFETLNRTRAFSNHLHALGAMKVDIMYIEGTTADDIFSSLKNRLIMDDIEIPVVSTEHLIALKLFAIQNDAGRKFKDLADVREIMLHAPYDEKTVKSYFKRYGQESYYEEVSQKSRKKAP